MIETALARSHDRMALAIAEVIGVAEDRPDDIAAAFVALDRLGQAVGWSAKLERLHETDGAEAQAIAARWSDFALAWSVKRAWRELAGFWADAAALCDAIGAWLAGRMRAVPAPLVVLTGGRADAPRAGRMAARLTPALVGDLRAAC